MTSEEIQIKQITESIDHIQTKLNKLRSRKISTEDQDSIGSYETILSDLKGQLKWWQRRLERDQRSA